MDNIKMISDIIIKEAKIDEAQAQKIAKALVSAGIGYVKHFDDIIMDLDDHISRDVLEINSLEKKLQAAKETIDIMKEDRNYECKNK